MNLRRQSLNELSGIVDSLRRKVPLRGRLVNAPNQDIGGEGGHNCHESQPNGGAPLVHCRDLFLVLFGLEQVRMSAELEEQVGEVCQEEEDRGTA